MFDIGGISVATWFGMFNAYRTMRQWPDGRALLDQPNLTVEVFETIDDQLNRELTRDASGKGTDRGSKHY
jgi:hypothetical protein